MDALRDYTDEELKQLLQRITLYHRSQRKEVEEAVKKSLAAEYGEISERIQSGDIPADFELKELSKTLVFPETVADEFARRVKIAHQVSFYDIENVIIKIGKIAYSFSLSELERYAKKQIPRQTTEPAKLSAYGLKAKARYLDTPHISEAIQLYIRDMVLDGLSIDKITERIMTEYGKAENSARLTARTESTRIENGGRLLGYESAKEAGVEVYKEWYATHDDRTRDSHAQGTGIHGEVRKLDEEFSNGGLYPADPNLPPEESCNCRCVLIPNFTGQSGA